MRMDAEHAQVLLIFLGILVGPIGIPILWARTKRADYGGRVRAFARFASERSYVFQSGMRGTIPKTAKKLERGVDTSRISGRKRGKLQRDIEIYRIMFPVDGTAIPVVGGTKARVSNLMTIPREEGEQLLFDHAYTIPRTRYSARIQQTFAVFRSGRLAGIPAFSIRNAAAHRKTVARCPEDLAAQIEARIIPFDDHPGFSEAYVVTGDDQDAIRRILRPELREALAAMPGYGADCSAGLVISSEYKPVGLDLGTLCLSAVERLDGLIEFNYEIARALTEARGASE